jgi:hypothetical protein
VACSRVGCRNFGKPGEGGDGRYRLHGRMANGGVRYWCKGCFHAFTVGAPARFQRLSHENKTIFLLLVNKAPIRAAARVADVSTQNGSPPAESNDRPGHRLT